MDQYSIKDILEIITYVIVILDFIYRIYRFLKKSLDINILYKIFSLFMRSIRVFFQKNLLVVIRFQEYALKKIPTVSQLLQNDLLKA